MTKITKHLALSVMVGSALYMTKVSAEKCYALAFSSGSESSAFQAGALQGILEKLPAD